MRIFSSAFGLFTEISFVRYSQRFSFVPRFIGQDTIFLIYSLFFDLLFKGFVKSAHCGARLVLGSEPLTELLRR